MAEKKRHELDPIAQRTRCGKPLVIGLLATIDRKDVTCGRCKRVVEQEQKRFCPLPRREDFEP